MRRCWILVFMFAMASMINISAAEQPTWYYDSPCQQKGELREWLANLEWVPYEYGVFDCSEMAAHIEWLVENCGYHAVIACGDAHCWVLIEGAAFEPTGQYWVGQDHMADLDYYHPEVVYEDAPVGSEWDWWIVHPKLRSP